jgi:vitamin B12 transporter
MIQAPIDTNEIVVTAARTPETAAQTPASVTIIETQKIGRLGEPLLPALLRLTPSAAVASSGTAGSLTEVRIRGAEANHTLLFIDGIRVNDPAAGNAPRFELLNADLASRLEVVRGPQSALWGSEAIGGVIAVEGAGAGAPAYTVGGEAGSFGFRRASASAALKQEDASLNLALGWQRARGIDSFDGTGDRDGYRNLSGRLRGSWSVSPVVELGVAGIALTGMSQYDGYDPNTFLHADTLDSTKNRLTAGRLWTRFGREGGSWMGRLSATLLGSSNRNQLDGDEINRTRGRRFTLGGQVERRFATGSLAHTLVLALDHEGEKFHAQDVIYGGFTDQDRSRVHQGLTAEWRAVAGRLTTDLAVRHDRFSRFKDATTLRASALVDVGQGFALAGSYGEGIAQPSFYDLYGFFPGSFVGNPLLKPESSRGVETSVRYRRKDLSAALTWYRQRLHDEIVDLFDPVTFLSSTANRDETSHRWGVEAELGWKLDDRLRVSANYAYLRATQPDSSAQVREVRRPKHSGSVSLDGASGKFSYGASAAYVGTRSDVNFDVYPSATVPLHSYWLAGARVAYAVRPGLELFARAANAFDRNYQDVYGYRTEGRSLYAGIRLAAGH